MWDIIWIIISHYTEVISAAVAVLTAAIAFFMILPGPEPEKTLQIWLDWLKQYSRK